MIVLIIFLYNKMVLKVLPENNFLFPYCSSTYLLDFNCVSWLQVYSDFVLVSLARLCVKFQILTA